MDSIGGDRCYSHAMGIPFNTHEMKRKGQSKLWNRSAKKNTIIVQTKSKIAEQV